MDFSTLESQKSTTLACLSDPLDKIPLKQEMINSKAGVLM